MGSHCAGRRPLLHAIRCARPGVLHESGTTVRQGSMGSPTASVVTSGGSQQELAGLWLAEGTGDEEGVLGAWALHFGADLTETATVGDE